MLSFVAIASIVVSSLVVPLLLLVLFDVSSTQAHKWHRLAPPRRTDDLPYIGALKFFRARWDFFHGADVVGNFAFMLGRCLVGAQSRDVFFGDRRLNFYDGYNVLYGAAPTSSTKQGELINQRAEDPEDTSRFDRYLVNRFAKLLKRDYYAATLPDLLGYTQESMDECAASPSGMFDPFKLIYKLIFRHTVRVIGCTEVATDMNQLNTMLAHFERLEGTFGPVSVVAPPWLPTRGRAVRLWSAFGMHRLLASATSERRRTGARPNDALQLLLDNHDAPDLISRFIISGLYAGQLNSGINAAYLLCYLACSPTWLAHIRREADALLAQHAPDPSEPLAARLARVPCAAWMDACPALDTALRETIRLVTVGAALRYNDSASPIELGQPEQQQHAIPPATFAAYHLGDVHYDPAIYPDPARWDPGRYAASAPGAAKAAAEFLGWGRGRHPCLGKALAQLEVALVAVHFVLRFDFELCDGRGAVLAQVPQPDKNALNSERPRVPLRLRVRERKG